MLRYKRHQRFAALTLCITIIGSLVGLVLSTSSSASGGTWSPTGDEAIADSANVSIEAGGTTVSCEATVGQGTLSATESATWKLKTAFSDCNDPVTVKGEWTATDVNSSEATLEIPKEEHALTIELSSKCTLYVNGGATLGSAGDYINGTGGVIEPSQLELTGQTMTVTDSPTGCLKSCGKEVTTAGISGTFGILNFTTEAEAIKVS